MAFNQDVRGQANVGAHGFGGGTVTSLPAAGSPLMAALVKFVQSRNPAVVVNEGNVGGYVLNQPGVFTGRLPGKPFMTGFAPGNDVLGQLVSAGLARPNVSPWASWGRLPAADLSPFQREWLTRGANARSPQPSGANMGAFRSAPPPSVPLATLPQAAPAAPAAPVLAYPPGPAGISSVDPEPPFGTPQWFAWRYGPSTQAQRLAQMRRNLAR